MSQVKTVMPRLPLRGGALCLNFANTSGWRPNPGEEEYLRDYEDLIAWAEHAGAVDPDEARKLLHAARTNPERARSAHRRAIALREAIYRIFSAVAGGAAVNPPDTDLLNRALGAANEHLRLAARDSGFEWVWHDVDGALELPLWRVVRSAASLLVSPEAERVRECSGENCDWLFLDESKNRSRRWCDMATCGNRAKARRNYTRRKQAGAAS